MFKFGFTLDDEQELQGKTDMPGENDTEETVWYPAEEIHPNEEQLTLTDVPFKVFSCGNHSLKYISGKTALKKMTQQECENILQAEQLHSDLVPGKYEGGLKIWECTKDLVEHILINDVDLRGKKVLDLGCGVGIAGLLAAVEGATVHFQDYNSEVIKHVTMPSVHLNFNQNLKKTSKCRFFAGDWNSFLELTEKDCLDEEDKYDYIFSSETIYNPKNYEKLTSVFKRRLKKDGTVFLAAKTYYFGVGGGTRQFEEVIEKENVMKSVVCWMYTEGIHREILEITFK